MSSMDIFNRPPAISEDTLQYALYLPPSLSDKPSVTTFATCMRTYVDSLLPGFIWHRDAFELKLVPNPDFEGQWMLEGRMRVGDSVDDEWCTVWLLKEISSKWDVVISVWDTDGEFLLIEAADALPSWVTPSNSENRVWIYNSHLHLIPLSHVSPPSRKRRRRKISASKDNDENDYVARDEDADEDDFIDVEDALKLVRDPSVDTRASMAVENLVWDRISQYPEAIRRHVHVTKAHLPVDIAKALAVNPPLVQKAVEAFYTRDGIQLREAHKMSRFPPSTSVLSTVKMTRTAYAQLTGQKFFPPKVFGRWLENEGSKEWRWKDTGMKIAVGFEILFQESKGRWTATNDTAEGLSASIAAKKDALRRDPEYVKYIQNLVSAGYFRGEPEGSQLWNSLEDKAAEIFVDVRKQDDHTRQSFASLVTNAISQARDSVSYVTAEEDNDEWLTIDAQDFDDLLQKSSKTQNPDAMDVDKSGEVPEDKIASDQASRLKDLASKVEEFVEGEGDMEGAKFEDEDFSDEEFSDGSMSTNSDDEDKEDPAKRQADMDKLVPGLDPSEYGQMPASFHSNSQKVGPMDVTNDTEKKTDEDKAASNTEHPGKLLRPPILPRDKYDGVDSDDESDEEGAEMDSEDEEDRPQVVGDIEVDMGEEEEEFLEFSRQALGISDEQWSDIVKDRKDRGAFVPKNILTTSPFRPPTNGGTERNPEPGARPNVNPNLDSFEAVMKAMDAELARTRTAKRSGSTTSQSDKGKGKEETTFENEDDDIEAAMEAELKAALEGRDDDDEEEPTDYNLIKNFLESFKSQAGLSGPVSNLAGRLQPGWTLPRDES
ncbi:SGT1 protein-domain-containing protein [Desarmillaria tabescens]|uniref:SGT1 protein-domain-containing protein n=1 Tax=Armillaria tabescens TaxID=1929756 RepID=A0AA39U1N0_ARMTA|nr:SGT1 protein-domain-containing protein [Desarmillaria tabescens]KAK0465270.1 SGT1 protein-domain-containing protein [Desarmillaria tabescens]